MDSSSSTNYLVTGANRGIGYGLLRILLSRPKSICIAAVRDPVAAKETLASLPVATGSKLIVVKIDSNVATDARDAVEVLKEDHGIKHLDVVVANAAIGDDYGSIVDIKLETVQKNIETNVYGSPITLFQAVLPLLSASSSPKFCLLGSVVGSIGGMEKYPYPLPALGLSKAMAHYFVRRINLEHGGGNGNVVAWCAYPGFVQTDTGNSGARRFGMKEAPDTIEAAAGFVAKTIDDASMENTGGRFPSLYGGEIEW
ncbi:hypothetical protein HYFRA_00013707 [Hymenoscyphus fraxineus]|uniref:NAD(P)-binding protein n=1 Tax=Hymenoscyphus fraxineus TaxID=746836 RepID=A0A9N9LCV3_9HELO|nr:hypothetical protein HYFRA_00013707 [Hymenoscyphus fraxineus]